MYTQRPIVEFNSEFETICRTEKITCEICEANVKDPTVPKSKGQKDRIDVANENVSSSTTAFAMKRRHKVRKRSNT